MKGKEEQVSLAFSRDGSEGGGLYWLGFIYKALFPHLAHHPSAWENVKEPVQNSLTVDYCSSLSLSLPSV